MYRRLLRPMIKAEISLSCIIAFFLVGVGLLGASLASTPVLAMPLAPGVFVAAKLWPEGIHTGAGLGAAQTLALYATVVVVTFLFWAVVSILPLIIMSWLRDLFRKMRR